MPSGLLDFLDHVSISLADFLSGGLPSKKEKFHEIPLDRMIKQSKLIVVGKVLRVKEPIFHKIAVATIEIEQVLVGSYEDKHIMAAKGFELPEDIPDETFRRPGWMK